MLKDDKTLINGVQLMGSPVNWNFVFFKKFNLKGKMLNVKKLGQWIHAKKQISALGKSYTFQFIYIFRKEIISNTFIFQGSA